MHTRSDGGRTAVRCLVLCKTLGLLQKHCFVHLLRLAANSMAVHVQHLRQDMLRSLLPNLRCVYTDAQVCAGDACHVHVVM
jgi:hypothetical protein